MGDERRGDGSGAVVAIVVILGILGLMGVVVVVVGAMFFVSVRSSDVQMLPPTTVVMPNVPPDTIEIDPLAGPAVVSQSLTIQVSADGKILLADSTVTLAELKTKLSELKQGGVEPMVSFAGANDANNEATTRAVTDLLQEMNIGFKIEPQ